MSVYLDYNATAPIDERVLDFMIDVYKNDIGNADSRTHNFGEKARNVVETARKQVASLLQVNSDEVFFTSGATESNNIAIQGLREYAEKNNKMDLYWDRYEELSAQKDSANRFGEIQAKLGDVYQIPLLQELGQNCKWNINNAAPRNKNILIEAPNGYGKTTFLRSILLAATYQYRENLSEKEKKSPFKLSEKL